MRQYILEDKSTWWSFCGRPSWRIFSRSKFIWLLNYLVRFFAAHLSWAQWSMNGLKILDFRKFLLAKGDAIPLFEVLDDIVSDLPVHIRLVVVIRIFLESWNFVGYHVMEEGFEVLFRIECRVLQVLVKISQDPDESRHDFRKMFLFDLDVLLLRRNHVGRHLDQFLDEF